MEFHPASSITQTREIVCKPEHAQEIAENVLAHRLKIDSQTRFSGINDIQIVQEILQQVAVPV